MKSFSFIFFLIATTPYPCEGLFYENYCYVLSEKFLTWGNAEKECAKTGGNLATVPTTTINEKLTGVLKKAKALDASWIGGQEREFLWKWVNDGSLLAAQGCYKDKPDDRDLSVVVEIPLLLPFKCMSSCRVRGYLYAAVQV